MSHHYECHVLTSVPVPITTYSHVKYRKSRQKKVTQLPLYLYALPVCFIGRLFQVVQNTILRYIANLHETITVMVRLTELPTPLLAVQRYFPASVLLMFTIFKEAPV